MGREAVSRIAAGEGEVEGVSRRLAALGPDEREAVARLVVKQFTAPWGSLPRTLNAHRVKQLANYFGINRFVIEDAYLHEFMGRTPTLEVAPTVRAAYEATDRTRPEQIDDLGALINESEPEGGPMTEAWEAYFAKANAVESEIGELGQAVRRRKEPMHRAEAEARAKVLADELTAAWDELGAEIDRAAPSAAPEPPTAAPELVSRVGEQERIARAREEAWAQAQEARQAAFRAHAEAYPAKRRVPVAPEPVAPAVDYALRDRARELARTAGTGVGTGARRRLAEELFGTVNLLPGTRFKGSAMFLGRVITAKARTMADLYSELGRAALREFDLAQGEATRLAATAATAAKPAAPVVGDPMLREIVAARHGDLSLPNDHPASSSGAMRLYLEERGFTFTFDQKAKFAKLAMKGPDGKVYHAVGDSKGDSFTAQQRALRAYLEAQRAAPAPQPPAVRALSGGEIRTRSQAIAEAQQKAASRAEVLRRQVNAAQKPGSFLQMPADDPIAWQQRSDILEGINYGINTGRWDPMLTSAILSKSPAELDAIIARMIAEANEGTGTTIGWASH